MDCPRCHRPVETDWNACPQCGERLPAPPEPRMTLSGEKTAEVRTEQILADRYRVIRELGRGGMGVVYLAEDLRLDGRKVALKTLPPLLAKSRASVDALRSEAITAMEISHPNVVTLRGFEETSAAAFLVMDYVDGRTLEDLVAGGPLTEDAALEVLEPVARALDYVHARGIVHRDLKPSNVMVARDGTPMITDFGIARKAKDSLTRLTGLQTSGTLLYMSPEQLMGEKLDARADVYSFAATFYECLTGDPPFTSGDIATQILRKVPATPAGVSERVARALTRGLSKRREERFASAGELVEACREAEDEPPLATPIEPAAPARPAPPPPERKRPKPKARPPEPPRRPAKPPRERPPPPAAASPGRPAPRGPLARLAARKLLCLLLLALALGGLALLNPHLVERLRGRVSGTATPGSDAAGGPDVSAILPAGETIFWVSLPRLDAALDRAGRFREDLRAAGAGRTPRLDRAIEEGLLEFTEELFPGGIGDRRDLDELGVSSAGAALAAVMVGDRFPVGVCLLHAPDPEALMDRLARRARRTFESGSGDVSEVSEEPGLRRLLSRRPTGGKDGGVSWDEISLARAGEWVLFASLSGWSSDGSIGMGSVVVDAFDAIRETADGARPSVGPTAELALPDRVAEFHVSLPDLLRMTIGEADAVAPLAGGVRTISAAVAARGAAIDALARLEGAGRLRDALRAPSADGRGRVPSRGLLAAGFLSLDPAELFPTIELFLTSRDRRDFREELDRFAQNVGLDPTREVPGALAGEAFAALYEEPGGGIDPDWPRILLGLRTVDANRALEDLDRLMEGVEGGFERPRIGGREARRVPIRLRRDRTEALEYALVDDWLVLGTSGGLLLDSIRAAEGEGESVLDDSDWPAGAIEGAPVGLLAKPGALLRAFLPRPEEEEREWTAMAGALGPVALTVRAGDGALEVELATGEAAGERAAARRSGPPYRTIGNILLVVLFFVSAFCLFRPVRRG